ncbi:S1 family peptidase [Evansella tamaricis]|uniref:Serine protease n=1 Tax=Evansella tamaricis TaxID=2069301 RepID=A0ABS6JJT5_9BACI|nr:serine protease [Evansella tamaricis]MBU9713941.1 serine protease [Evansella tamaricis]
MYCQEGIPIKNKENKDNDTTQNESDQIEQIQEDKQKLSQEELYFDGENYYTREEFFNPEEEEEATPPKKSRKWLRVIIATVVTVALLTNVLQMWPRIFNFDSIEFLQISRELSQDEDVQLYKESIVVVRAGGSKGTGFYISQDGLIITNHHVIENEPSIMVSFQEGDAYRAKMVESNEEIDIAILQIEGESPDHPTLDFDNSWETGMPVFVIGNPLFFNFIANKGNVIGMTEDRDVPFLMLDAPIYRGNSGSPVINEAGKVIAVVFATNRMEIDGEKRRVGLAVPVDYFKEYLN